MTKRKQIVYDGVKAVDLWNGDRGWDILSGPSTDMNRRLTAEDYFIQVPWLYRAVKDRATSVKKVTFAILNGSGEDVDNSGSWADDLGIFPYPRRTLHQIEESLVMAGKAYLFLETNPYNRIKAVKYILPTSIKEVYDDNGDLQYYERSIKGKRIRVNPGNICAIYDPDHTVEQGPGQSSAAKAALMAAGVLFNTDQFIASYFARGAIKATVLSVDTSDQKEAIRLQAWWEDVVGGIKNAWSALVIRGKTAVPVVIGQGLEGLENDSLTMSKRQDISTAIGVPESRMWAASANFATAEVEAKAYFNDVIIPECWLIEEAFNAQIFTREHGYAGYRWEFRPESNEGFGKDQQAQAAAFASYVTSGIKQSIAAQFVGLELPEDMEYEDLDPEEKPAPDVVTVLPNDPGQLPEGANPPQLGDGMPSDAQAMRSALYNWKSACLAAVKTGHPANIDFDNPAVPQLVADFLHYELDATNDTQAVNDLFRQAREMCKSEPIDPIMLELKRANDLLAKVVA
jgi:hypothetical protein